ncbi:sulfite exporter TauE/SafE family protein [Sulfurimonas sp. CVO]|uniref:sulfite exporter TauE/SafE family protein n=1 Tax=Sulfurimonas sp. CVO TaxID=2283483 RepID=UPI00132F2442|nr:sulfite exporter TauE/SafE family protein [Sulfurimonas sp. CVO]QHG90560.1 sulfite exporter TauE/SafE family protein [Sulfurimonas sp. CVO]
MIYLTIFLVGLQLGATACAISCLPIMTPILLANNSLEKKYSLKILFEYFIGKVFAYIAIAITAFFGANIFKNFIIPTVPFEKIGAVFIIFVGLFLLYRSIFLKKSCSTSCSSSLRYGYFGIGFFSSFSFCLPVMSLIATSALSSSILTSALYGLFFAFGVILVPFLLLYFFIFKITNEITKELHRYKKHIEVFASILILLVGVLIFFGLMKV